MDFLQLILLFAVLVLVTRQKGVGNLLGRDKTPKLVLDSCALIDGRIVELVRTGFVAQTLIIPQFIIHELQLLADGNDAQKRARARFGLDMVRELQDSRLCTVIIDEQDYPSILPTDDKLVALAKERGAQLYTTDFNLNKVAEIQDVRVLNVNDLAQNLRPVALPGERRQLKLMQKGSNPKQGVGYLDDGTMVVVENGAESVGKVVNVEITRMHQTVAGKMLFAETLKTSNANKQASLRQLPATVVLSERLKTKRQPRHIRPQI